MRKRSKLKKRSWCMNRERKKSTFTISSKKRSFPVLGCYWCHWGWIPARRSLQTDVWTWNETPSIACGRPSRYITIQVHTHGKVSYQNAIELHLLPWSRSFVKVSVSFINSKMQVSRQNPTLKCMSLLETFILLSSRCLIDQSNDAKEAKLIGSIPHIHQIPYCRVQ